MKMKLMKIALAASAFVVAFQQIGSVRAGTLDDVVRGVSAPEKIEILGEDTGERAAVSKERVWSKWEGITGFNNLDIVTLNVCAWQGQAKDRDGKYSVAGAKLSVSGWSNAMQITESVAWDWTRSEDIKNGRRRISRLVFSFRNDKGNWRACENHRSDPIRILFNKNAIHRSEVGTDSARLGEWSMTMGVTDEHGNLQRYVILHEFGHALGFIHEMGHPDWKICSEDLKLEALYREGMFGDGFSKEEELGFMKRNYRKAAEGYGDLSKTVVFDPSSVMTYHIPASAFRSLPRCAMSGYVPRLSGGDREQYLKFYGRLL